MIENVKLATHLLGAREIVVDIETETTPPYKDWGNKFGVSYVAPMTLVAFHTEGFPTVVLDLNEDDREEKEQFIRKVLSRPNIRIIGHNIVFDLRQLGGHLGFTLPVGVEVWDTMTMALLLLMCDNPKGQLSLKYLTGKYNLLVSQEERDFQARMKDERESLSFSDRRDAIRYAGMDVDVTWRLYWLQRAIIDTSADRSSMPYSTADENGVWGLDFATVPESQNKHLSSKSWNQLPDLVSWELRKSWLCSNMAIRGVKLDKNYVRHHVSVLGDKYEAALRDVLSISDPTSPDGMPVKIAQAVWVEQTLNCLRGGQRTPDPKKWFYYDELVGDLPFSLTEEDLWHGFPTDDEDEYQRLSEWVEYIVQYPNRTIPEHGGLIPTFDLQHFVYRLSTWPEETDRVLSGEDDEPGRTERDYRVNWWRAKLKAKWFSHYLTQRKSIEPEKLVNKDLFQPYFVFVVCGVNLPTNDDIAALNDLVTTKVKNRIGQGEVFDFVGTALDQDAFSLCEEALNFYFTKDEDDATEHPFVVLNGASAKLTRADEFLRHSERDGRIHSMIVPKTRTSRGASSAMNLQNMDMGEFAGYLVADNDDRLLGGVDVSNAENWFAALTFADSDLAYACASGDFHYEMMKAYWFSSVEGKVHYEEFERIMAAGGEKADEVFAYLKKMRKKSKFVTFGGAYGAGARKIASMVKCSVDEAKEILANRDRKFSRYSEGKKKLSAQIEASYRDGNRPAYTTLWTGRRIPISMMLRTKKYVDDYGVTKTRTYQELASYKGANYLQQGGVAELIWRAMVIAAEVFELEDWDVYIASQVHDEIIFDAPVDVFFEAAQKIIEIIATIVPEAYRNRTVPACRFLAEIGPENAYKWGFRFNKEYPLPLDKFANRWGVFDMPEGEQEAPTWPGPIHEGYSVAGEIKEAEIQRLGLDTGVEGQTNDVSLEPLTQWRDLEKVLDEVSKTMRQIDQYRVPARLLVNEQIKGPFQFPERMIIHQILRQRGQDPEGEYFTILKLIQDLQTQANALHNWQAQYGA